MNENEIDVVKDSIIEISVVLDSIVKKMNQYEKDIVKINDAILSLQKNIKDLTLTNNKLCIINNNDENPEVQKEITKSEPPPIIQKINIEKNIPKAEGQNNKISINKMRRRKQR